MTRTIPYRITIELATDENGDGVTLQLTGTTADMRSRVGRPSTQEATLMAAHVLAFHAAQAKGLAEAAPESAQADIELLNMPVSGRRN